MPLFAAAGLALSIMADLPEDGLFASALWLMVLSFFFFAATRFTPKVCQRGPKKWLTLSLIPLAFFSGVFALSGIFDSSLEGFLDGAWPCVVFLSLLLNSALCRRTAEGSRLLDQALGIEACLTGSAGNCPTAHGLGRDTPETFEAMLPYAVALGRAQAWAKRFEQTLSSARYSPAWYRELRGPENDRRWSDSYRFAERISPLASNFTSDLGESIEPPGTTSGSDYDNDGGDGGSSGGGGGGGGGCGW